MRVLQEVRNRRALGPFTRTFMILGGHPSKPEVPGVNGGGLGGVVDRGAARASFDEFVRARSAALGRTAYLLTGNRHDAEDLLQSALARVALRWLAVDDAEAYVRRVLYTQAISRWRALRRRPAESLGGLPARAASLEPEMELRVVLERALRRLTPRQRAVLVLRYYEDRSEVDTADILGCAVGTVKSQTRHALARLRALNPDLAYLVDGYTDSGERTGGR
jgi:RNA polymerase sigma-70 factor (sigma-E family)